jgi:DamX protein
MDTGFLAALDEDVVDQVTDSLIPIQPFSPPSLSSSQLKQLELLQHLSLYSELLILVCADKGMGKTFIAKALLASREMPDQSLMLEADFSLSYLDVLHNLAQFLDLAELADDVNGIEQQVLVQCLEITEEDQGSVLLIIDQADQLSDHVLEDINQLSLLAPTALHIMLLAPLGFDSKLSVLPDPQAPFHVMVVEPFIDDEAEILLLEQFPDKDWAGEQGDYIVQQSVGNPGKILYLAQQIISGVKPQQKEVEAAKFPITHIAAMLLVASALGVAYFYQSNSAVSDSVIIVVEPSVPFVAESILTDIPQALADETLALEAAVADEGVDFNFAQPDIVGSVEVSKVVSGNAALKEDKASELEAVAQEAVSKESKVVYSKDEALLLSAASDEFVIQLFGSYSSNNAQSFISTNRTKAIELRSYQTQHQGKPWFVVIAGPVGTKLIATQQAGQLSAKLRQQKPWIRAIAPIQVGLKARK